MLLVSKFKCSVIYVMKRPWYVDSALDVAAAWVRFSPHAIWFLVDRFSSLRNGKAASGIPAMKTFLLSRSDRRYTVGRVYVWENSWMDSMGIWRHKSHTLNLRMVLAYGSVSSCVISWLSFGLFRQHDEGQSWISWVIMWLYVPGLFSQIGGHRLESGLRVK